MVFCVFFVCYCVQVLLCIFFVPKCQYVGSGKYILGLILLQAELVGSF